MKSQQKTVFLGLSGGVDSSVSALLLQRQGYRVVGVYMKNWSRDLPGHRCPWSRDLADAKRVAVRLGMDFRIFDFEREYRQKVVDYMLAEYRRGRTPNPDIMCNQEIKFKLFAETAFLQGADLIATGHYAQTDGVRLMRAVDENKDQTYFLHRISQGVLARTLFPVGQFMKPEVKRMAAENGLHTAAKPESMGICFVGRVGIRDFLSQYFPESPGEVVDADTGAALGTHDGAIFYTLGQRHGLELGGGLPYYIVGKDMERNVVYVSRNLNNKDLWTDALEIKDLVIRSGTRNPKTAVSDGRYACQPVFTGSRRCPSARSRGMHTPLRQAAGNSCLEVSRSAQFSSVQTSLVVEVRLRHRAPLVSATLEGTRLTFAEAIKRPAPGQSAAIYRGEVCLGGGIIV